MKAADISLGAEGDVKVRAVVVGEWWKNGDLYGVNLFESKYRAVAAYYLFAKSRPELRKLVAFHLVGEAA